MSQLSMLAGIRQIFLFSLLRVKVHASPMMVLSKTAALISSATASNLQYRINYFHKVSTTSSSSHLHLLITPTVLKLIINSKRFLPVTDQIHSREDVMHSLCLTHGIDFGTVLLIRVVQAVILSVTHKNLFYTSAC